MTPPVSKTQLAEGLTKARDLVAAGWFQLHPQPGCECAVTALAKAFSDDLGRRHAREALVIAIGLIWPSTWPGPVQAIIDWNDDDDRTQAEVVAAFNRAIEAVSL